MFLPARVPFSCRLQAPPFRCRGTCALRLAWGGLPADSASAAGVVRAEPLWSCPGGCELSPRCAPCLLRWSLPECSLGGGARPGSPRGAQAPGEPPFPEAGGHLHKAAGNEQDSKASASAGGDTTNTRHSEPDVANQPQISARQRPGCGERLPRSGACVRCWMRVIMCVCGRGQGDSPQRGPPNPTAYRLYAPRQQTP